MDIIVIASFGAVLAVAILIAAARARRDAIELERYLKELQALQAQESKRLRYPFI